MVGVLEESLVGFETVFVAEEKLGVKRLRIYVGDHIETRA